METLQTATERLAKIGRLFEKAGERSRRQHCLFLPTAWEASRLATSLGHKYRAASEDVMRATTRATR